MRILRVGSCVVRIPLPDDLDDSHYPWVVAAGMVEEGQVSLLHLITHEIPRLEIPDAVPVSCSSGQLPEIVEGERVGIRLEKPVVPVLLQGSRNLCHSVHRH